MSRVREPAAIVRQLRRAAPGVLRGGLAALAIVALVSLGLAPGTAQQPSETAAGYELERVVTAEVATPAASVDPDGVEVLLEGRPAPLVAVEPVARSPILVWIDVPLLSPQGADRALELLSRQASELVALGPVTVGRSGLVPETVGDEVRDAAELRRLLDDLRADLEGDDELGEAIVLRRGLIDVVRSGEEGWRAEAQGLLGDEERLLLWQLDALMERLAAIEQAGEAVLFWVQDAFDPAPLEALEEVRRDRTLEKRTSSALADDLRELARSIAAEGWTVVPVQAAESDDAGELAELLAGAGETAGVFAEASGGRVVTGSDELASLLDRLGQRLRIRYRAAGILSRPAPVDVRVGGVPADSWRRWMTTVTPDAHARHRARGVLGGWLEPPADDASTAAEIEGSLVDGLSGRSTVEVAVRLPRPAGDRQPWDTRRLRLTLLLDTLGTVPWFLQATGDGQPLGADGRWRVQAPLELPADLDRAIVLVEDLAGPTWVAAEIEPGDVPLVADAGAAIETLQFARSGGTDTTPIPGAGSEPRDPALIELVPPRQQPVTGKVTLRTLVSNDAVRSTEFFLDGEPAGSDTRPPFQVEVDLGDDPRPREVRVVGYGIGGDPLDDDTLVLNREARRQGLRLVLRSEGERLLAEVELDEKSLATLDRLELYRNRELLATLSRAPFRWSMPTGEVGPSDFVRAVAWLEDGSQLEDAAFLAGMEDRVEVNLVQLFVVVTDQEDRPVQGLEPDDFTVRLGREERTIDRFAVAEEVPLLLGLVVDTSLSMMGIMTDTQRAAAQFLATTVTEIDRAFVVDFDDRPRLAQGLTGDLVTLMRSLATLEASGATALYDSIVFSLLQFDQQRGRRALVLLSDGDDYRSRFGYGRVWRTVRDDSVPVYVIGLEGMDPERPSFRKADLEAIAEVSGGRVFYVRSLEEVDAAYRVISGELRNQYVLGLTTERPLTRDELSSIEVETDDRRLKVRFTAGQDVF